MNDPLSAANIIEQAQQALVRLETGQIAATLKQSQASIAGAAFSAGPNGEIEPAAASSIRGVTQPDSALLRGNYSEGPTVKSGSNAANPVQYQVHLDNGSTGKKKCTSGEGATDWLSFGPDNTIVPHNWFPRIAYGWFSGRTTTDGCTTGFVNFSTLTIMWSILDENNKTLRSGYTAPSNTSGLEHVKTNGEVGAQSGEDARHVDIVDRANHFDPRYVSKTKEGKELTRATYDDKKNDGQKIICGTEGAGLCKIDDPTVPDQAIEDLKNDAIKAANAMPNQNAIHRICVTFQYHLEAYSVEHCSTGVTIFGVSECDVTIKKCYDSEYLYKADESGVFVNTTPFHSPTPGEIDSFKKGVEDYPPDWKNASAGK